MFAMGAGFFNSSAGAPYYNLVMAKTPLAYWRCGESSGSVAADSSGNGYTGTYVGGTQGVPALINNSYGDLAYRGNGATGQITVGAVSTLYNLSRSFSICAWTKPIQTTDSQASGIWSSGLGGFAFRALRQSGAIQVEVLKDYTTSIHTFFANLPVGVRCFIAVVVSSTGNISVYANGSLVESISNANTFAGSYVRLFSDGRDSTTVGTYLFGDGDELAVFNRELLASEVLALWNAGK